MVIHPGRVEVEHRDIRFERVRVACRKGTSRCATDAVTVDEAAGQSPACGVLAKPANRSLTVTLLPPSIAAFCSSISRARSLIDP